MENKYWGYHLTLDCGLCDVEAVKSSTIISEFIKELVPAINMVAYGHPQIFRFGSGHLAGVTLLQMIETSNIAAHFCDTGQAFIDVFSCKEFDIAIVDRIVRKYFKAQEIKSSFLKRQAKETIPYVEPIASVDAETSESI
jgi:S-adenosylmethionine/arginine decarboxylase-like enzyme